MHVAFAGGRLPSEAATLLPATLERRLKSAERLAACLEDPRDPDRVRPGLAEMIGCRALLIAAGHPDGIDRAALKSDPAFKTAVGRLPESGADLCSRPTVSRLENLPDATAPKRARAAMVELFCDSFDQTPRRIPLDIGDTGDRVHGGRQLSLCNAYYDGRCLPKIRSKRTSRAFSDRTSCRKAAAAQLRLPIHTAAYRLILNRRGLAPRTSFWREARFDTIGLCPVKIAGRVTERVARVKIAPPGAFPCQAGFAALFGRLAKLPP